MISLVVAALALLDGTTWLAMISRLRATLCSIDG
ncbi:hypothetical protein M2302_005869 [Micromonospora sp. A200]|nr:hypothetical protein [Micromonospora sp. A200]